MDTGTIMPPRAGGKRKRRRSQVPQFAENDLPLEFQRNHKEKERHQPVVDPVAQRTGEVQRPEMKADRRFPERQERG
jgi:hypothetical protein